MPLGRIKPRKCLHHGRECWRIIVPKDIRGDGQTYFFFDSQQAAAEKAQTLEKNRTNAGVGLHALSQQGQALIWELEVDAQRASAILLKQLTR